MSTNAAIRMKQPAADIELAAVRSGNRNFAGLGWPGKDGRIKQ